MPPANFRRLRRIGAAVADIQAAFRGPSFALTMELTAQSLVPQAQKTCPGCLLCLGFRPRVPVEKARPLRVSGQGRAHQQAGN
jgi:hypothetical protein